MKDKGFDIFLMVLFGMGGIIILVITGVRAMALSDRIVAASFGLMGISFALSRTIPLKSVLPKISAAKNFPEIESKEKPRSRV